MQWRSRHAGLQPAAAGLKGSAVHRVFAAAEFNAIARQRDDRIRVRDRCPKGRDGKAGSTERHAEQSPAPQGRRPPFLRPGEPTTYTPGQEARWIGRILIRLPSVSHDAWHQIAIGGGNS